MNTEKAKRLLKLHHDRNLLILPNIWNPIGAKIQEEIGYPAVATASASVSASLGFQDGERIRRETYLDILERITKSVSIPVTADIESGYGDTIESLRESIEQFINAGVVGINIEDSLQEGGDLRNVEEQCERIASARDVGNRLGIDLVINARVDSFLSANIDDSDRIEDAVLRAGEYAKAGADCIYPIGPGDYETVLELRKRIESPINILGSSDTISLKELEGLGVNRVSFGPYIFRSCYHKFIQISKKLYAQKSYDCFNNEITSGEDMSSYLDNGKEER